MATTKRGVGSSMAQSEEMGPPGTGDHLSRAGDVTRQVTFGLSGGSAGEMGVGLGQEARLGNYV